MRTYGCTQLQARIFRVYQESDPKLWKGLEVTPFSLQFFTKASEVISFDETGIETDKGVQIKLTPKEGVELPSREFSLSLDRGGSATTGLVRCLTDSGEPFLLKGYDVQMVVASLLPTEVDTRREGDKIDLTSTVMLKIYTVVDSVFRTQDVKKIEVKPKELAG
ncbi:MAG: hypothetical protein P0S95_04000 [Rhabdochlamydiaceae bacterium]|nr:hypothetical protein [Candidatus Amphrikana amoebophyrae]